MNSHIANLYLSLLTHISKLKDTDNKPYFRFIDQDYGQLEYHGGDNRPPVSWPCLLIDVDNTQWSNMGGTCQPGIVTVKLRLGFPAYSGTSNLTDPVYRQRALAYYDLEQVLHLALHGWSPVLLDEDDNNILADTFGSFIRQSTSTELREDLIRVRVITYTIPIEDYSTRPGITFVPATANFTFDFDI